MKEIDVTDRVDFNNPDDEFLPLTQCVCGQDFLTWTFTISIYSDTPTQCEYCGRRFFFRQSIRVIEVVDE